MMFTFYCCPECGSRLRLGWPRIGAAQVKCGYCGAVIQSGLVQWENCSTERKLLLVIGELFFPSIYPAKGINLFPMYFLLTPALWFFIFPVPLLIFRINKMIKESNEYSHNGIVPTWKWLWQQQF